MPIPVGKLSLYVAAGGINPATVLPIVLDVGTDNEALRKNRLYLGTPSPRISGEEYYEFLDEFMHAVYSRWPGVLVQFEDFKNPHAQNLLVKYRDRFCCFNDGKEGFNSRHSIYWSRSSCRSAVKSEGKGKGGY